jgi:hypothetical protein
MRNTAKLSRHLGMDPQGARLSCLAPYGSMQICSRQICAEIQTIGMY